MLSFPSSLCLFSRTILSFVISSLIVFIYLPSDYSFTPAIFQHCLALEVISSSSPLLVAKNDAKVTEFDFEDYTNGYGSKDSSNYALKCGDANTWLGKGEYYLWVKIGELSDYIIPYDPVTKGRASVCDALTKLDTSELMLSYYLYSSIKPSTSEFNGGSKLVPKWDGGIRFYLGGSDVGISDDDRFTITRWGRVQKKEQEYGACCFNTTAEAHKTWQYGGWGKPFTITAHKLNGSFLYLSKAVAEYKEDKGTYNLTLKGKINDLYLNIPPVRQCIWSITLTFLGSQTPLFYQYQHCEFEDNKFLKSIPSTANFFFTYKDASYNKPIWPSKIDTFKNITFPVKRFHPPTTTTSAKNILIKQHFRLKRHPGDIII